MTVIESEHPTTEDHIQYPASGIQTQANTMKIP